MSAWTRELAVTFALYAMWQLAGNLSLGRVDDAVERGRSIARAERWIHLPSEASFQRLFLAERWLIRLFNVYYIGLHVAITGICLVWVFARHRDRYPAVRNTLALCTGASLLVALVPVAPPRLVPGLGLVDTGRTIGPTVYPATARPGLDQLSAMPSVHVAWALVAAGAVVYVLRSPWRWLAALYPVGTIAVVVATGNHYWADAGAAVVLFVLSVLAVRGWDRRRARTSLSARPGGGRGAHAGQEEGGAAEPGPVQQCGRAVDDHVDTADLLHDGERAQDPPAWRGAGCRPSG